MNAAPELLTEISAKLFLRRAELFDAILVIRVKKRRDVYAVQAVGNGVYLCEKVGKSQPEFGPYRVELATISRPGDCSCQGFGRWGVCKHYVALFENQFTPERKEDEEQSDRSL